MKIFNLQFPIYKRRNRGQSLFEVLVAIAIAAIIMTGIVSLTTVSVRNATHSRNNALATKYTQEGVEWLREQRDTDWNNLTGNTGTKNIGGNPPDWNNNDLLDEIFRRTATLSYIDGDSNRINATVTVEWDDGGRTNQVKAVTRFTNWNR